MNLHLQPVGAAWPLPGLSPQLLTAPPHSLVLLESVLMTHVFIHFTLILHVYNYVLLKTLNGNSLNFYKEVLGFVMLVLRISEEAKW